MNCNINANENTLIKLEKNKHRIADKTKNCNLLVKKYRSSHAEVFLGKDVLKICSKCTGEHPCRTVISIKLLHNLKIPVVQQ